MISPVIRSYMIKSNMTMHVAPQVTNIAYLFYLLWEWKNGEM